MQSSVAGAPRACSIFYLVAAEGLIDPHELPEGWGLLVRKDPKLELVVKSCLRDTTPEERVALVERIAAAAIRERKTNSLSFLLPAGNASSET